MFKCSYRLPVVVTLQWMLMNRSDKHQLDPKLNFFGINGWLVKIYDCFSAKPENCGDGIFQQKTLAIYKIYSCCSVKLENTEAKKVQLKISSVANFIAIVTN